MAGQRQPIELVIAKGKKHLTKAEIEERQRTEVKAAADKVTAPQYLSKTQKTKFKKIVKELRAIDLISNLDVDALARLVIAQEKYIAVTQELERQPLMVEIEIKTKQLDENGQPVTYKKEVVNGEVERLALLQDRYFRQCRQGAADFGLTVSSRCRLVVPKADKETQNENKFAKFA
uniref:Terminase small subunit n=1 Tax=Myoviridae sp. ctBvM24 TaxID=2825050 RepID=A0A8S5UCV5_9CAUD|nr:MAG TPA: terminase small subunit [Myoviridae sp. ctBvM24]